MVIIGVKNLGNSLCNGVLTESAGIVTLVEHLHIEGGSLCLPQSQNGNALAVIAGNVHIIGNCNNGIIVYIGNVVILLIPEIGRAHV